MHAMEAGGRAAIPTTLFAVQYPAQSANSTPAANAPADSSKVPSMGMSGMASKSEEGVISEQTLGAR